MLNALTVAPQLFTYERAELLSMQLLHVLGFIFGTNLLGLDWPILGLLHCRYGIATSTEYAPPNAYSTFQTCERVRKYFARERANFVVMDAVLVHFTDKARFVG